MKQNREPCDVAEWAALYAAGALSADEQEWFESRLAAEDIDCLAEFNDLDLVVDALAEGVVRIIPAPEVRERLMRLVAVEARAKLPDECPATTHQATIGSIISETGIGETPLSEMAPSETPLSETAMGEPAIGSRPSDDLVSIDVGHGADVDHRAGLAFLFARGANWEPSGCSGIMQRILNVDLERRQYTAMLRCGRGAVLPPHRHSGSEQTLVIEGDLQVGQIELGPGDFQRASPGSKHHRQSTRGGCLLLVVAPLETLHAGLAE